MNKSVLRIGLIAAICGLVYFFVAGGRHQPSDGFLQNIRVAQTFYLEHRLLAIAFFCCAHIVAAMLSVPGSCSLLNVAAGSIFGFWQGCAIVYPITMFSAALGYAVGRIFRSVPALRRMAAPLETLRQSAADHDYFYFVTLRLSPLLPFGMLNLAMGFFAIPIGLYFLTTFVGIFFDVVLLNNVGAAAFGSSRGFVISFFILFFVSFWVRMILRNRLGESL